MDTSAQSTMNMYGGRFLGPMELFKKAWDLFMKNWKLYLGIQLLPVVFIIAITIIFILGAVLVGFSPDVSPGVERTSPVMARSSGNLAGVLGLGALSLVFYIAFIVVCIWSQIAMVYAIALGGNVGIKQAFMGSKSKVLPYLWISFLTGLFVFIGYSMFLVPGILFAVWFMFATFVFLVEDKRGLTALLTSRGYTRGRWLNIAGRLAILLFILIAIYLVVLVIISALGAVAEAMELTWIKVLLGLIPQAFSYVFSVVSMIYLFVMYDNLRSIVGNVTIADSTKKKYTLFGWIGFPVAVVLWIVFFVSMVALINPVRMMEKGRDSYNFQEQLENKQQMKYGTEYSVPMPEEPEY
jgi:hypothetical protein